MVQLKLGNLGNKVAADCHSPWQKVSRTTKTDSTRHKPQSAVAGNRRSKAYHDENSPSLLESSVDDERLSIDDVSDGSKTPPNDMLD